MKNFICKIKSLFRPQFEVVDRIVLSSGLLCVHTKNNCSGVITIDVQKNDVI